MKFKATIAKTGSPNEIRTIEAPSRFAAYDLVEKEGKTITNIEEVRGRFTLPPWLTVSIWNDVKHPVIGRMAKNLSTMLGAGLSLSRALSVIERQSTSRRLKEIAARLSEVVAKGTPFHAALAEYPKVFPEIFIAMVKVGEESGSLDASLGIVGLQMEHADELSHKVRGALIYPCIVLFAIVVISVLMLIFVVPTLTETFAALNVSLPLATQIFVSLSDFVVAHLGLVIGAFVLLLLGGVPFLRSEYGSGLVLRFGLHLPVVGDIIRETYAARTARTLSSLLAAGVPVLEALAITKEVVRVDVFARIIEEAMAHVKKGEPLSAAFTENTKIYPILMGEMIMVGEETGKVSDMLKQMAEFYETDVSEKTKDLSTIIEPLLMLLIGGVVGIFAISMIAPIYSLSSAI